MNWISEMFEKGINKEASNAQEEFTKKVKNSPWISGAMDIDESSVAKEADAKIEAELAVRKEAAYEAFQDTEEVLKQDYSRDVEILSDFTLASMIAEVRGHAKQDFPENATEYFDKAKRDVKADRKAVEKELLEASGMSAQLDWRKSFSDYKKDEKPAEATEKELYQPKLKDVNDDLSKGGKEKDYVETDKQHLESMQGVGREEKERIDVTQQAGEVHKDASLIKEASLDEIVQAIMNGQERINTAWGTKTAQGIEAMIRRGIEEDKGNPRYAPDYTASLKTAALVRDPESELRIGTLIRLARSIMSHEGIILAEGTLWEVTGADSSHYIISANGEKHVISSHDTPKFDTIKKNASQEIENKSTKEEVLKKVAEISSPWKVITDPATGQEVVARIENDNKTTKESEEEKTNLNK